MKKILLTGMSLGRNLGGPAMGLTIVDKIRERYPDAQFKFAVSAHNYEMEGKFAAKYGFDIVPITSLIGKFLIQPVFFPLRIMFKRRMGRPFDPDLWEKSYKALMNAIDWSDYVINMEGVCYVGDGTCSWIQALCCYSVFYFSNLRQKPYCRFVQSYGPFDDWRVRLFAKRELKKLPFIAARGKCTAAYCRVLAPDQDVFDVPDIAILLQCAQDNWAIEQLAYWNLKQGEYTILSPSAVIRHIPNSASGSVGVKHVDSYVSLSKKLLSEGESIVFLPHMYSDVPNECDREVCKEVIAHLPENSPVFLVEDDIDPRQAKWLISHSKQAIVSRFHAMVAAISTCTPVVAIGWNIKYKDMLEYYQCDDMAIDARVLEPSLLAVEAMRKIKQYDETCVNRLREAQDRNTRKVNIAFNRLYKWIDCDE